MSRDRSERRRSNAYRLPSEGFALPLPNCDQIYERRERQINKTNNRYYDRIDLVDEDEHRSNKDKNKEKKKCKDKNRSNKDKNKEKNKNKNDNEDSNDDKQIGCSVRDGFQFRSSMGPFGASMCAYGGYGPRGNINAFGGLGWGGPMTGAPGAYGPMAGGNINALCGPGGYGAMAGGPGGNINALYGPVKGGFDGYGHMTGGPAVYGPVKGGPAAYGPMTGGPGGNINALCGPGGYGPVKSGSGGYGPVKGGSGGYEPIQVIVEPLAPKYTHFIVHVNLLGFNNTVIELKHRINLMLITEPVNVYGIKIENSFLGFYKKNNNIWNTLRDSEVDSKFFDKNTLVIRGCNYYNRYNWQRFEDFQY